jgi:hypothetical protein
VRLRHEVVAQADAARLVSVEPTSRPEQTQGRTLANGQERDAQAKALVKPEQ